MYGLAGLFVVVVGSVLALLGAGCLVLAVFSVRQVVRHHKEGVLAWGWGGARCSRPGGGTRRGGSCR